MELEVEKAGEKPKFWQTLRGKIIIIAASVLLVVVIVVVIVLVVVLVPKEDDSSGSSEGSKKKEYKYVPVARSIGIGGGGMLFRPEINPNDKNNLALSTDMGDVYVSTDRGKSWKGQGIKGYVAAIWFDRTNKNVVYFGAHTGFYRSTEKGMNPKLVFPKPEHITAEWTQNFNNRRNFAVNRTLSNYPPSSPDVESVASDPNDPNHVLILFVLTSEGKYALYESFDGCDTFERTYNFTDLPSDQRSYFPPKFRYYPKEKSFVLVFKKRLYLYKNNEMTVLYEGVIHDCDILPDNYFVIITDGEHGIINRRLIYTNDFITIHQELNDLLETLPTYYEPWDKSYSYTLGFITGIGINELYLSADKWNDNSTYSIIKITNRTSYSFVYSLPFLYKENYNIINKGWVEKKQVWGSIWGLSCTQNGDVFFSTLMNAYLYNGSVNEQMACDAIGNGTTMECKGRGLNCVTTYYTRQDPFDDNHLIMCVTDFTMMRSYNFGKTWIQYENKNTCYDLHFDTKKKGVVYAIFSGRHDAPYSPQETDDHAYKGYFAISYDAGTTFNFTYSSGLPEYAIPYKMQVVYDGDKRTIYLACFNFGFYVSYDSGAHFVEMNQGIEKINDKFIFAQDIEVHGDKIFGLTAKVYFAPTPSLLLQYVNSKWTRIDLGSVDNARDLAYSEEDDGLLIGAVGIVQWSSKPKNKYGGLMVYKDGNITNIFDDSVCVFGVNINDDKDVYLTALGGAVYVRKSGQSKFELLVDDLPLLSRCISFTKNGTFFVSSLGYGTMQVDTVAVEV